MNIRQVAEADVPAIVTIYNHYVQQTIITFETEPLSVDEMAMRIRNRPATHDWVIGEIADEIVGYAYYGVFRPRAAYAHTVESTVYLAPAQTGKGYGRQLYARLLASARERGFREMIGVIALPNPTSLILHQRMGFHEVGVLRGVGYKLGQYIDVGIWQASL